MTSVGVSGCMMMFSYTELDWDGSNELMDLWELFGLRGGCKISFREPINGKLQS